MDIQGDRRKDAIRALINLAVLEGMVLFMVIAVYLMTNEVTYVAGGFVGSALIFGPMLYRWYKEHGEALRAVPQQSKGVE
jgi:hypothetical protein